MVCGSRNKYFAPVPTGDAPQKTPPKFGRDTPLVYYECELTNRQLPQLIAKGRCFCNQIAYSLFIFQNPNSILWLQKNRPFVIKLSESLRPRPPLAMALLKANGGGAIG